MNNKINITIIEGVKPMGYGGLYNWRLLESDRDYIRGYTCRRFIFKGNKIPDVNMTMSDVIKAMPHKVE